MSHCHDPSGHASSSAHEFIPQQHPAGFDAKMRDIVATTIVPVESQSEQQQQQQHGLHAKMYRLQAFLEMEGHGKRSPHPYEQTPTDYDVTLSVLDGECIALEGPPCVGKTTLLHSLKAALEGMGAVVDAHEEDREDKVLAHFFQDRKRLGFMFQLFKLTRRQLRCEQIEATRNALQDSKASRHKRVVQIEDRTLPGDMAFAFWNYCEGNMSKDDLDIYLEYADQIKARKPMLVIYQTAPVAKLVERVAFRADADEMKFYDADFFNLIHACYMKAFARTGCAYHVVDWSAHFDGVPTAQGAERKTLIPARECLALVERCIVSTYAENQQRLAGFRAAMHKEAAAEHLLLQMHEDVERRQWSFGRHPVGGDDDDDDDDDLFSGENVIQLVKISAVVCLATEVASKFLQ